MLYIQEQLKQHDLEFATKQPPVMAQTAEIFYFQKEYLIGQNGSNN